MTAETILELPGSRFGGVFVQSNGDVWAATEGHGLYRRRTSGEIDHWTTDDGLPTRFLGGACTVPGPTESTHLWINSGMGILAISFDSLERAADGEDELLRFHTFRTGESLGPYSASLPSGVVVFPTVSGPVSIDTHQPLPRNDPPALSTATIWAEGEKYTSGSDLRGYTDLEFEYGAAQFPYRPTSLVQFRLQGHDEDWNDGGQDRLARYTALPPGTYEFQLRARTTGSDFGPILKAEPLTILPHWHQRYLVRIGLAAALFGLCIQFFRVRTRRILRHSQELEAEIARREKAEVDLTQTRSRAADLRQQLARSEEQERSRLARKLHDDFSQRLAALSLNLQLSEESLQSAIDPTEHAALLSAQAEIEELAADMQVISRQLHPAVLDDLGLSAALRSECNARNRQILAELTLNDDSSCAGVRGEVGLALFRVAQEALQNASSHANADTIAIRLHQKGSNVELCVRDNGRGFELESTGPGGLGLSSMRERMNLVGGHLKVNSVPGKGTLVCAQAPLLEG